MGDPHAQAILNLAADDFGKWAKGRYRVTDRNEPPCSEDPLAVFRAAIRREALEEAARLEAFAHGEDQRRSVAGALRAAILSDGDP